MLPLPACRACWRMMPSFELYAMVLRSSTVLAALVLSFALPLAVRTTPVAAGQDAARPSTTMGANERAVEIVIFKSTRTLALYRSGNFVKEFSVVLGLAPEGRKRHEDDARTPEGLYRVIGN